MKALVQKISLPAGRRVLVVSDIHGMLPWLQSLLDRANFSQNDILILLGDLLEKGPESLATLRYVMALSQTHTVYTVSGNCDGLAAHLEPQPGFDEDDIMAYLRVHPESIVRQMAKELTLRLKTREDLIRLREALPATFGPELAFLRGLPTILESPDYVFVHGGVPSFEHMEQLDAWACMKNDAFWLQGYSFPKYCVVGHWPVTLYREEIPCFDPLIDRERKIISIDGGCGVKIDGQLNLLILPERPDGDFSWLRQDGLPLRRALDRQDEGPSKPFTTHWTDNTVDIISPGDELTLCRHRSTGRELLILNDFLSVREGRAFCQDSTDYRLPVNPGDLLSLVAETGSGALMKKDGVTGWYYGRLEAHPPR